MIDIKIVRDNKEAVKEFMAKRLCDISVDELFNYDTEWKKAGITEQNLRARRNTITEEIKIAKSKGLPVEELLKEAKEIPAKLKEASEKTNELLDKRNHLLEIIPNIPHESTPAGLEENFKIVKTWGDKPKFDFKPKNHFEIASALDV